MSNLNSDDFKKWKNTTNKLNNKIKKSMIGEENLVLDKRRNVNGKEKDEIWNNSKTHNQLDPNIFRLDVLGNVIIKNIKYSNNTANKIFAGEYEHILSHSKGGKSNIENVCLLNAGINRSKSNNELYTLKYYEMKGLCNEYGMNVNDLLFKLKYEQHEFCEEYDLYFEKVNGIFTTKVYNTYKSEIRKQEKFNDLTDKLATGLAVTGLILIVEHRNEIKERIINLWNWARTAFDTETIKTKEII
jgi:hypothetical protein